MNNIKRLYRNDIVLAVTVILLCVACVLCMGRKNGEMDEIEVTADGVTIAVCSLSKDCELSLLDDRYTLTVKNGTAKITKSDCPDHICSDMRIDRGGGQILCLPAKLRVAPKKQNTDIRVG